MSMTTTANLRHFRRPSADDVQRRAAQLTRGTFAAFVRKGRS